MKALKAQNAISAFFLSRNGSATEEAHNLERNVKTVAMLEPKPAPAGDNSQTSDFIDTDELCRRLGISPNTAKNWRDMTDGLPYVRTPGGRGVRYFWPSVRDYLVRRQRNVA